MSFIDKIKVNNDYYSIAIPYTVCETSAATAAKTATCSNFAISDGTQIKVKFTYANTAANPTLNINSTGAKNIVVYGNTPTTTNWKAGSVVEFTYDGAVWVITGFGALQEGSCTVSGGELSKGTASGGDLSGGILSGGDLSGAGDVAIDIYEVASGSQDANVTLANVDIGSKDTTNYPYYFKVGASGTSKTITRAQIDRTKVTRAAFSQVVNRAAVTDTHTEGYIPTQAATTVINSDSTTVSLSAGELAADNIASTTATVTANEKLEYVKLKKGAITASGSVSVSGSGNVNPGTVSIANQASATVSGKTQITAAPTTDTSNINTYYMAVKATAAANNSQSVAVSGSGTGTASVTTEGYVKTDVTGTGTISASGNAAVNVNSKDSSVTYIPLATAEFAAETAISGSGQITLGYGKQRTLSAGYTSGLTIKNSVGAGTITNNTSGGTSSGTINRGSQIKIGAGYYPSDLYYTAQSNSGNVTITQQSGQSVNGYATATVRDASTFSMTGSAVTDAVVTIGTLSSGYYPVSAKVKGTITADTAGWFTNSGAVQASIATQVGKIAASSVTRSGNTLSWGTGYITSGSTEGVISVSDSDTLTSYLIADNAGKYYKYTGTSNSTYTNGNIYTYES